MIYGVPDNFWPSNNRIRHGNPSRGNLNHGYVSQSQICPGTCYLRECWPFNIRHNHDCPSYPSHDCRSCPNHCCSNYKLSKSWLSHGCRCRPNHVCPIYSSYDFHICYVMFLLNCIFTVHGEEFFLFLKITSVENISVVFWVLDNLELSVF